MPVSDLILLALRLGLGLVMGVAALSAVLNFRRSRSAPYFILRRAAAVRAGRRFLWLLGASLLLALTFWVRLPPLVLTFPGRPALPSPAVSLRTTPNILLTDTAPTTPSPANVAQTPGTTGARPTGTLGTRTPPPSPSPVFATRESDVTPAAVATLSIIAVSTDITDDFLPANPGTAFAAGVPRIYVFFDFQGMSDGVSWSGVLLLDGQVVEEASFDQLWTLGQRGVGLYRWFERETGWPVGEYEVRYYVGDRLADSVTFRMVRPEDLPGGPSTQTAP